MGMIRLKMIDWSNDSHFDFLYRVYPHIIVSSIITRWRLGTAYRLDMRLEVVCSLLAASVLFCGQNGGDRGPNWSDSVSTERVKNRSKRRDAGHLTGDSASQRRVARWRREISWDMAVMSPRFVCQPRFDFSPNARTTPVLISQQLLSCLPRRPAVRHYTLFYSAA